MIRTPCLIVALTLAGCGAQRTTPVAGVVLLDGRPLAGASIQFVSQGKGHDATGATDKNGEFVMSTFQPRDGMLPGTYKVVISPPVGSTDTTQYASADEAMSAANKPKARKESAASAFPQKYARPDQTPLTQEVPVQGKLKFELKSS
ncbi:MAG: carboxypeptidase regulatory-like domain-containing protein [Alphaproteobacteria bacterium]|nr:MAG: carboxypeptidase regulatory-like domain-containing protein [Alphaproteobacteria bacterium]